MDKAEEELKAAGLWKDGMTIAHVSRSYTHSELDDAFAALDRNSWETTCTICNEYYTGIFNENGEAKCICPKCGSTEVNGLGSPAGGMNLMYHMDF